MTSSHASAPAAYAFRFTRAASGYNVGHLPTLDSIEAGAATPADGRHLGRVTKIDGEWLAITPDGLALGENYRTRAEAAQALLVTADRVAEVEAVADAAEVEEPVIVRAGQLAPLVQDAPLQVATPAEETPAELIARVLDEHPAVARKIARAEERARHGAAATARLVEQAAAEDAAPEPLQVAHLMGEDLLAACGSTGDALGLYVVPSSTPERITCRRCLLTAVDEEVRRLGYTSAAAYLQAPGREGLEDRVRVAAIAPDGTPLPREGVDLPAAEEVADAILAPRPVILVLRPEVDLANVRAELQARPLTMRERAVLHAGTDLAHARLAALVEPGSEVDDPREQPEPLEWSEVTAP